MSEYSDFPRDFITRTLTNMSSYTGQYEVTDLINNCLGLIIIPKQHLSENLPEFTFTEEDTSYGITKTNITLNANENYSLRNVVRHIRNGLAHGRIEQRNFNGEIEGVRIYDCKQTCDQENFAIELTIKELKDFATKLSYGFTRNDAGMEH